MANRKQRKAQEREARRKPTTGALPRHLASPRDAAVASIATEYVRVCQALVKLFDLPSSYSIANARPTTDVSEELREALDKVLRLALKVSTATLTSSDWWARQTLVAMEPTVDAFLSFLRSPDEKQGEELRKIATRFDHHDPERGQMSLLIPLALAVRHAIHPSVKASRNGEAQHIVRVLLPQLGATRSVAEDFVLTLLDSWAARPTHGKRTVAGIVAELMHASGLEPRSVGASRKSVSTRLTTARIRNTPQLLTRADGTIPGRSALIAIEPLTFYAR